jgi:predicted secreted protein
MRKASFLVAALVVTACTPAQKAHYREQYNLDSPTLVRDAAIDGQTVTLKRGQALVVRLDADPATGMRWEMVNFTSAFVLAPVQHDLVANPGTSPVPTGVPGEAVFRLRGIASGSQPVALEYRRPYEAATRTVRFDVVVL